MPSLEQEPGQREDHGVFRERSESTSHFIAAYLVRSAQHSAKRLAIPARAFGSGVENIARSCSPVSRGPHRRGGPVRSRPTANAPARYLARAQSKRSRNVQTPRNERSSSPAHIATLRDHCTRATAELETEIFPRHKTCIWNGTQRNRTPTCIAPLCGELPSITGLPASVGDDSKYALATMCARCTPQRWQLKPPPCAS